VPQGTPEIVSKLADRGEEALQKIASTPAAQKLLDALTGLRDRMDELQRRVSGVEALEKRVAISRSRSRPKARRRSRPRRSRPRARRPRRSPRS